MNPTKPIPKKRRAALVFWLAAAGITAAVMGMSGDSALASVVYCNWGQPGCTYGDSVSPPQCQNWTLKTTSNPLEANFSSACSCSTAVSGKANGRLRFSSLGQEAKYKLFPPNNLNISVSIRGGERCRNTATGAFFDAVDFNWKTTTGQWLTASNVGCSPTGTVVGTWGQLRSQCFWTLPIGEI